jgi:hypothetical protein
MRLYPFSLKWHCIKKVCGIDCFSGVEFGK